MHLRFSSPLRPARRSWVTALLLACLLILPSLPAHAQDGTIFAYGQNVAGEVADILDTGAGTSGVGGELWRFYGCQADLVELRVEAKGFTPRLDLFGPGSDVPIAAAAAQAGSSIVTLTESDLPGGLPANGEYLVTVDGRSRSDGGAFRLTLTGPIADVITLAPGQAVTGTLRSGRSQEWTVYGCAGDLLDLDMTTGAEGSPFRPVLEVYGIDNGTTLATSDPSSEDATQLQVELPATGVYVVVAAGAGRGDRGDYVLTYHAEGGQNIEVGPSPTSTRAAADPTATPSPTNSSGNRTRRGTPQPRATRQGTPTRSQPATPVGPLVTPMGPVATPSPTATRLPTATPVPTAPPSPAPTAAGGIEFPNLDDATLDVFCTVLAERLNLRPGPGTQFNPPIRVLEAGEILVGIGRTADSTWVLVGVLDAETFAPIDAGWASADYLFCVGDINTLPVVEGDS